jgi:DNA-binding response OmpR family regulator
MENKSGLDPILIIDNDAAVLKFLMLCLSRKGYCVDIAGTVEKGGKKIKTNNYSLIIADLQMPELSGDQIYDFLRYTLKKSTPIVGMSGTLWFIDKSNFDAVLPKPCSIKELLTVIDRLI